MTSATSAVTDPLSQQEAPVQEFERPGAGLATRKASLAQTLRARRPRQALAAVIATVALASTAACSGSDSNGSGNDAAGGPFKVMLISTIQSAAFGFPEAADGANAAAKEINDAGGINGHKVEVEVCNDQFDPNAAAACAQKAVQEKVSAVVTGYTSYGSKILPLLESAKIPFLGLQASHPEDINNPMTYAFASGSSGVFSALAIQYYKNGCTKAAVTLTDNSESAASGETAKKTFEHAGGEVVYTGTIPHNTADMSPAVTAIVKSGAECVISVIPPTSTLAFIPAMRSAAPDIQLNCFGLPAAVLSKLKGAANNCVNSEATYPEGSTQLEAFTQALHAYKADAAVSGWSLNAYNGVKAAATAGKDAKGTGGADLVKALNKTKLTLDGFPAEIDFSSPKDLPVYKRVFNTLIVTQHLDGTKFVAYDPVDTYDSLKAAS
jgi:ABC-type branched-subunit amino acid transport system substrate-binding protein